jgi:predicted dinucleotide-binding enzyme
MKLAIIGSGRVGSAFATASATRTSHAVAVRGSHAKSGSAADRHDARAGRRKLSERKNAVGTNFPD